MTLARRSRGSGTPTSTVNGSSPNRAAQRSRPDATVAERPEEPKRKPKAKGPSKNRVSAQQRAERAVEAGGGARCSALEAELTDPAAWASRYESAKSEARHTAATRAVEDAYARLETLVD